MRQMKPARNMLLIAMIAISGCSYLPEETRYMDSTLILEETGDYILLGSDEALPEKAFLFVPGGFVDPHVYLCWMTELVNRYPDLLVVQLKHASNLAILNSAKVSLVMKEFDGIESWIIGGHSLGGIVSVFAVAETPDHFDGLILLASWATESRSLQNWETKVLSIYASKDGLATEEEVLSNKAFLPADTEYVRIEGGNHSAFGCYGLQHGDMSADITQAEQQEEMLDAMIHYFNTAWE